MTDLICIILLLFQFAFFVRLVLGFFPIRVGSPAATLRGIAAVVTEPVVQPLRRAIPPLPGAMAGFGVAELAVLIGLAILLGVIC